MSPRLVLLALAVLAAADANFEASNATGSIPVKVFLSLRNISNEAALRNFKDRSDEEDLQAAASDSDPVDVSAPADAATNATARRTLRGASQENDLSAEGSAYLFTPFKHKKIDTAVLSDCALQGDWHPIGGPRQHHQLALETGEVPVASHAHVDPDTVQLVHSDRYHAVKLAPPRAKDFTEAVFLSPPPVPHKFTAEKPHRPKHRAKKPRPFVHATISEVPVSDNHYLPSQHVHQDYGSSSFTCGKTHDHGTNFHTATFQVVGVEGDHGHFAQETHPEVAYAPEQRGLEPPADPHALEHQLHMQELAASFPSDEQHLQDVIVPAESAPGSDTAALPAADPPPAFNPWNEQYESATTDPVGHRYGKQEAAQPADQATQQNGHSYFYEIDKVSQYPNTLPYEATAAPFTDPEPFSEEHREILKELEQFSNELNNKYEHTGSPAAEYGVPPQVPHDVPADPVAAVHEGFNDHSFDDHFPQDEHFQNQVQTHENHENHFPTAFQQDYTPPQELHHLAHHPQDPVEPHHLHHDLQSLQNPPPAIPEPYIPPHTSSYEVAHPPLAPQHYDAGSPLFLHDGHAAVNVHAGSHAGTPPDDHYRKVNQVNLQYVTQMEYQEGHDPDHPYLPGQPKRTHHFRYTVHHEPQGLGETQPVFTQDPVRLPNQFHKPSSFHIRVPHHKSPQPITRQSDRLHFSRPISADDVNTPKHNKPKVHKNPKRKRPSKDYEVHEHSGEMARPLSEIFPPKKMPKQFNNRKPNVVTRPKKGNKPLYVPGSSELKAILHPPARSKQVQRNKRKGPRVVKKTPTRVTGRPHTDKTVRVNSSLDPNKKQVLARVMEVSGQ